MTSRITRLSALLAIVMLAAAPSTSFAQFTSYVAHPPRAADTARVPLVATTDSARRAQADSARRVAITDMKTWVDSAAVAGGTRIPTPVDTTVGAVTTPVPGDTVTTVSEGMRAPDTASPLPTLLLGGLGAVAAGLALLRRRR